MGTMWWMVHQETLQFSNTLHPDIQRMAKLGFGKPFSLVTSCWFQHRKTSSVFCGKSQSKFTAKQGIEMSQRAHLHYTEISPHHSFQGFTSTLNTEISWKRAPWPRLTLRCECKICAGKTQPLNWLILVNKDIHSKDNFKEIIVKVSYFSHARHLLPHVGVVSEKSLTLSGHIP